MFVLNVATLEFFKPENHLMTVDLIDVFPLFLNFSGEGFLLLFQLCEPGEQSVRGYSLFDGFGDVGNSPFDLISFGCQFWYAGILFEVTIRLRDCHVSQFFYDLICQQLHSVLCYCPLDPVFLQWFFVTRFLPLASVTGIVIVNGSCSAGATFPVHRGPTVSTEEFSGEEVIYFGFASRRGLSVLREPRAYRFKERLVDDSWNTVLDLQILVFVNPDVPLIAKDGLEGAAVEWNAFCSKVAF